MKKVLAIGTLALTVLIGLAGCGNKSATANAGSAETKSAKIVAVGSTALQPLVEQAASQYQAKQPSVSITVQGGGSGQGLSQVSTGAVTVGNSDIFAQEKSGLKNAKDLVDHKVAVVGIAPVVNKDTGIKNVTKQQLIDLFQGKIKNWKELGGKDVAVVLINRAQGSGTRATFEKWGMDGKKAATSQEQDSSGTVQKMVATTPGAISYLAFSYIKSDLQELSIDNIAPTEKNVQTNTWKIWAYEHMYTKGAPNAATAKFIHYIQGSDIQKSLVPKLGYIPVTQMQVERQSDGVIEPVNNK